MTDFRSALGFLDEAAIPYRLRKTGASADVPREGELDIWIDRGHLRRADEVLWKTGFRHLAAPGHPGHRFYVAFDEGHWLKLDAKVQGTRATPLGRVRSWLDRRRPAAFRRLGPVVAVLGPDGAGKGSLISALRARIPFAVTPLYLGGAKRRSGGRARPVPSDTSARPVPAWKEVAGVARRTVRAWGILFHAYAAAWRGHIVLCDRHPIEALAVRGRRTPAGAALERLLMDRFIPKPDAILILDAPGTLLYRRKGEHSVEVLERWRRGYAEAFAPEGAVTISTAGRKEVTLIRASEVVWEALRKRRGW